MESRGSLLRWRAMGLVVMYGACNASNDVGTPALMPALLDYLLAEVSDGCDNECDSRILVHPLVGDEYYSDALAAGRAWQTVDQLPVEDGEVRQRNGVTFRFTAFDSTHVGSWSWAMAVQRLQTEQGTRFIVSDYMPDQDGWTYYAGEVLTPHLEDGRWTFKVVGVVN